MTARPLRHQAVRPESATARPAECHRTTPRLTGPNSHRKAADGFMHDLRPHDGRRASIFRTSPLGIIGKELRRVGFESVLDSRVKIRAG
jgi:hypothetical protein